MNIRFPSCKSSAFVAVISFMGLLISTQNLFGSGGLPIGQAQRDFQARYYYVNKSYVSWPNCPCGGVAPNFPSDDYYGDAVNDPEFAASLVADLANKFFTTSIYDNFVNGDIEGQTAVLTYTSDDMPQSGALANIDTSNYAAALAQLQGYLDQLTKIERGATQGSADYPASSASGSANPRDGWATCDDAEEQAIEEWEDLGWSEGEGGVIFTPIGIYESSGYSFDDYPFPAYGAQMVSESGQIVSDLTQDDSSGSAMCYLQVNAGSGGVDNDPPVSPDLAWHALSSASPGTVWPSTVLASDEPSFSSSCADDGEYGWYIANQVVIVEPDFTSSPDSIKCGCSSTSCSGFGSGSSGAGSVEFTAGLGFGGGGKSAGWLLIHEDSPSLALATPQKLHYGVSGEVVVIVNSGTILRQALAPQGLVDVVTNSSFSYDLRYYPISQVGTLSGGLYQTSGSPMVTYTIENPDASTNTFNRLRITEVRGGVSSEDDFVWTNQVWQLTRAGGLRTESMSKLWDAGHTNRTDTFTVTNPDSSVAYKETTYRHKFPWGAVAVVTNIVGSGSGTLTTSWIYYDSVATNDANYGRLKQMAKPTGYWETYQYDSSGRQTNVTAQYLDSTLGSPATSNRVTSTTYSTNAPQETIIVTLLGQEVSRHYRVFRPGEIDEIQCQTAGAGTNAADNLITATIKFTSGSFSGNVQNATSPDGTMTIYEYSSNSTTMTTISYSGQPNSGHTAIVDGTKSSNVVNFAGQPLLSASYDIASGLLLSQSTTIQTDNLGRATMVVSLDGTNNTDYGCCNIESSTNQEGIVTINSYDGLKRLSTTTQAGITTSNAYDAANRVIATFRNGVRLSASGYDSEGRLVSSTDARTNTTSYAETTDGSGHLVKTATYTNGTTRIETYYQDGQLYSVTGTAVHGVRYAYGADGNGAYTQEIKLNTDGSDSSEWTKTYTDLVGHAYKTIYADSSSSQSYYNNAGQMVKQVDPDGVTTLYAYNAKGELVTTAVDVNQNGVIDVSGTDRITSNITDVVNDDLGVARRTRTYAYSESGAVLNSTSETRNDGLLIRTISFGLTNKMVTTYDQPDARRTVTTTKPDASYMVAQYQNGRIGTNTVYDSTSTQISRTTYGYDTSGRSTSVTDARTGATTYTYNNADQVTSMSMGGQLTSYEFDSMGHQTQITLPDNGTVNNAYYGTGELATNSGARTYPVAYTYDYAGRMKTMLTWQNFTGNSGTATTTWNYNASRGFLTSKTYADSSSVTYSNSAAGRLIGRTWARGITTTYAYNTAGDLGTITYSDGTTPSVASVYDRRGRKTSVISGAGTCTYTYNDAGQILTESFPSSGVIITNTYDSVLRRSTLASPGATITYGYDNASRLNSVSDGTHSAAYTYLPNSSLVSNIVFATSGTTKMTTTKGYDSLNRLTSIRSVAQASLPVTNSFNYTYNSANQRTQSALADGSYWLYTYDSLGQVTSGQKYWSDNTPVAGEQFGYAFDTIGNRQSITANGNTGTYTANSLNQYTQRSVPGDVWELGNAASNATVTVNLQTVNRRGTYFSKELSVANSSSAVYTQLMTTGVLKNGGTGSNDVVTTATGHLFVAQSPELFGYDADGNLTNDGRFSYQWDAENRLIGVETAVSAVSAGAPHQKLLFGYDYQSRRVSKVVSNFNGGTWSAVTTLKFIYDRWNLLVEIDTNNAVVRSYTWGLDLSGSPRGAGGIGGLLMLTIASSGTHLPAYDGNGNIIGLVDGSSGITSAQYEYGPFGDVLRATGMAASLNPLRFSTKYADGETGLLYYGYRYYCPNPARWSSRDPSSEGTSFNLYSLVDNRPFQFVDYLGLKPKCCVKSGPTVTFGTAQQTQHGFSFSFNFKVEYEKDGTMKEGCCCHVDSCQFRQLVRGSLVLNGELQAIKSSGSGLPISLDSYVDDGYNNGDDTNPDKYIFESNDSPSLDGLFAADNVNYYLYFTARVIDVDNGGSIVAEKAGYWVRATGKYPRVLKEGGF